MAIEYRPYLERVATNLVGVAIGYMSVFLNWVSNQQSTDEDWSLALFGAVLIPVVSRMAGAQNRRRSSRRVQFVICASSCVFAIIALGGFAMLILKKRGFVTDLLVMSLSAAQVLTCTLLVLGLLLDLLLVAAEREAHEPQFQETLSEVWNRIRRDLHP